MKKLLTVLVTAAVAVGCNSGSENSVAASEKQEAAQAAGQILTVDTTASTLNWYAEKQTGKHDGSFKIDSGSLAVDNGQLTGGSFVFDIAALQVLDLTGEDKGKLEGHLKSPAFFEVDKFPTAKFEITKVEAADSASAANGATHLLSGNLTLKDSTKNVTFPAKLNITESALTAQADVTIDRTQWGLNYKGPNNPQDWFIKKEVSLKINLAAKK